MRPFQQADPNAQLMLIDRGNRSGSLDSARPARRRGARRAAMSDALASLAFTRLFPFVPIAHTTHKSNRARTA